MLEQIIDFFKNKSIAILGFGKEGESTYRFLRKYLGNIHLFILDQKEILLKDENITIISGENYLNDLAQYDIIMKTPGISLKDICIDSFKDKIYSQLEILLMFDKKNVIGITGTKGKSTTTSLIYQILKNQLQHVFLAGNIGIPIFDEIDIYQEDSIIVVEMSSHQLEYIRISPHIGVILNLYEDHLDHVKSVEEYHQAKLNMFRFQDEKDIAVYVSDSEFLNKKVKEGNFISKLIPVSLDDQENEKYYVDDHKRNLLGSHNLENIYVAMHVAKLFCLDLEQAKKDVDAFKGLEHRLEYVGIFDDVVYYNDTIATIPEATISGIEALKNVNTLIFGGMDRGIHYEDFIEYLRNSKVENLICMPTTGTKIGELLVSSNKNIIFVNTLEEAVKKAKEVTKKNTICLLSPAASSYEYFKNFEEKGIRYKELVKTL